MSEKNSLESTKPVFRSTFNQIIDEDGYLINQDDISCQEVTGKSLLILRTSKDSKKNIKAAKDIFNMKSLPDSMTIIGAGAIGIEFAYFFNAFGVKITLIEAQDFLLPNEDEEIGYFREAFGFFKEIGVPPEPLTYQQVLDPIAKYNKRDTNSSLPVKNNFFKVPITDKASTAINMETPE